MTAFKWIPSLHWFTLGRWGVHILGWIWRLKFPHNVLFLDKCLLFYGCRWRWLFIFEARIRHKLLIRLRARWLKVHKQTHNAGGRSRQGDACRGFGYSCYNTDWASCCQSLCVAFSIQTTHTRARACSCWLVQQHQTVEIREGTVFTMNSWIASRRRFQTVTPALASPLKSTPQFYLLPDAIPPQWKGGDSPRRHF